jgi:hypothetical protein
MVLHVEEDVRSLITVAADTKATRDGPPVLGSALRTDRVVTSSPAAPDAAEALAVGLAITSSAPLGLSSKPRSLKGRSTLALGSLAQPARVDCTITLRLAAQVFTLTS